MAGHRLLVVEDDAATQDALREIYTRQGWHVSVAGTEVQALACLDSEPEPCCLVLDLMLPDGDGSAVLKKVRAKGLRTRVAVCSGTVDLALTRAVSLLKLIFYSCASVFDVSPFVMDRESEWSYFHSATPHR
jgi:DNA-binding response OmpR family regulator